MISPPFNLPENLAKIIIEHVIKFKIPHVLLFIFQCLIHITTIVLKINLSSYFPGASFWSTVYHISSSGKTQFFPKSTSFTHHSG